MAAKTAAQRKAEQRERDKMTEEQRLARLLSRRITTDLFKGTDAILIRDMARVGIEEEQDYITRLIHGASNLTDSDLEAFLNQIHTSQAEKT
ncbi:hypothetical protein [Pseudomonas sp. PDM13]|uniref:hypothetical protein n=1 Tax=Pseudomonas sp. PDM13 TaxID=2769255 RepID=UPI0021DFA221|nr:hypothetical protein [Pseudomonas sp. PDM13]MCU9947541.1 hypothetical protein [Pseudomonas sp. PDM13]